MSFFTHQFPRRFTRRFTILLLPGIVAAQATPPTHGASGPVEEVRVTADWHGQALQDLPVSATVVDRVRIDGRAAAHLEDILAIAPNVHAAQGASRSRYFQIRGIGERGQFAEPLNPSVGLVIDGVDFSGIGSAALLFDVEQVEILRGPQGTRYGANALAGLINVVTRAPADRFGYRFGAEYADHDSHALSATVTGPLWRDAAGRLAVQRSRSDGFIRDVFVGRDTSDRAEDVVRGRLQWQASEALVLDATVAWIDNDNGYDAFSLDNDRHTRSDQPGQDEQRSRLLALEADWSGGRGWRVEGLLGFSGADTDYGYDEDWSFTGFHPDGYSSTDRYRRDRWNRSAELRVLSDAGGRLFGDRADWVLGLYHIDSDEDLRRDYTFLPGPFESRFGTRRTALFGQLDAPLGSQWTLTGGVRVERRSARYRDSAAVAFDPGETLVGGQLALQWDPADAVSLYATLARGFKAGGFNTDGSLDADLRQFDDEALWSAEFGVKARLLDERLGVRAAAFTMQRDDVQIASSLTRVRPDGSAEFIAFTGNAAEGRNHGLELEADWLLGEHLTLSGALGLLATEYRDFVNANGDDLDGRDQAHAPRYQYSLAAAWTGPAGWSARLELDGRARFYFSDGHDARARSYELLHAAVAWTRGPLTVQLFARNLLDEHYATRGFRFGNDPRTGYADNTWIQLGEPRRVGLRVDWSML